MMGPDASGSVMHQRSWLTQVKGRPTSQLKPAPSPRRVRKFPNPTSIAATMVVATVAGAAGIGVVIVAMGFASAATFLVVVLVLGFGVGSVLTAGFVLTAFDLVADPMGLVTVVVLVLLVALGAGAGVLAAEVEDLTVDFFMMILVNLLPGRAI